MSSPTFKTIIVGVDFSPYSRVVSRQALKLAEAFNAEAVFVNAISNMAFAAGDVTYLAIDDLLGPAAEQVKTFYKLAKAKNKTSVVAKIGSPTHVILSVAENYPKPLIVVGHKGRGALGHFFLGSTAEALALHATCPIWIHRGSFVKLPSKILLPSDLSKKSFSVLKPAQGVSDGVAPKLEFFYVEYQPLPILDTVEYQKVLHGIRAAELKKKKQIGARYPTVTLKSVSGDVVTNILKESRKFDLIAMSHDQSDHNHSGILNNFGSVTAKVVRSAKKPVLVMH